MTVQQPPECQGIGEDAEREQVTVARHKPDVTTPAAIGKSGRLADRKDRQRQRNPVDIFRGPIPPQIQGKKKGREIEQGAGPGPLGRPAELQEERGQKLLG